MTVPVAGRGNAILAVYGLFTALTSLSVVLRTYCRVWVVKSSGWDDGLAVVAWILFVSHAACAICGVHHGTGQHAWNIQPPSEIPVALKFWWLCEPIYVLSNMAIKASICLQLLRFATKNTKPAIRITVYTVLIVTEVFSAAFFIFFILQCQPSAFFWTRYTGGSGSCIAAEITVNIVYAYSAITCVGAWILAIIPCILVWDLQMKKTQKAFVAAILAMGAVASAATVARIPYIHTLADQKDFLYSTSDVAIWSCSETGLAITAACCATLRPLVRNFVTSSSRSAYDNNGKGRSDPALSGGHPVGALQGKNSHRVGGTQSGRDAGKNGVATEELQLHELQKCEAATEQCPRPSMDSAVPCDFFGGQRVYVQEFPSKG